MDILRWLWPILPPLLFGLLCAQYLTVRPLKMEGYLVGATVAFLGSVAGLFTSFRGWEFLITIPLGLGFALAGYVLIARSVLARDDPRPVPELTRARGDPGLGHTAAVCSTHGEPETYDPTGWINQFREVDEHNIPFVPFVIRPILLSRLRRGYLKVGKSDHRQMHTRMLKSLEGAFRAWMEFKEPKPGPKVEEFGKNGVKKVLFFAAAISTDAMHRQYDIPELVHKARVPKSLPLVNLGAWKDDPLVIQAIKEKIEAQLS